jgi:hypothetical protein
VTSIKGVIPFFVVLGAQKLHIGTKRNAICKRLQI